MHSKTRDLLTHTWQSQANLSLFLFLLVIVGFVIPSLGLEKNNFPLYADIAFSVVLVAGCWDRLGEPNTVRPDIAGVCRGDYRAVGDVVESNLHAHTLASYRRVWRRFL